MFLVKNKQIKKEKNYKSLDGGQWATVSGQLFLSLMFIPFINKAMPLTIVSLLADAWVQCECASMLLQKGQNVLHVSPMAPSPGHKLEEQKHDRNKIGTTAGLNKD